MKVRVWSDNPVARACITLLALPEQCIIVIKLRVEKDKSVCQSGKKKQYSSGFMCDKADHFLRIKTRWMLLPIILL